MTSDGNSVSMAFAQYLKHLIMNILLLGSTGRAGSQILKHALERGHTVTVLARTPTNIKLIHSNLKILKGDALSIEHLEFAALWQDAIVTALSTIDPSQRMIFTNNILQVSKAKKIERIIAFGGIGALQASENLKVYETPTFPKEYVGASQAHVRVLDALITSNKDYTFVCPPMIREGDRTGDYKVQATYPPQGWSIKAGDIADFVVEELECPKFVKMKVGIAN